MKRLNPAGFALVIDDERWRKDQVALKLVRRAATLALKERPRAQAHRSVNILLADDRSLRRLNRQFRGRDETTNVLSFNSSDASYLGDIAIGFGIVAKEARAQRKSFAAHAAHLTVHGVLHLLGYDHAKAAEARAMETLETLILSRLGLPDPYAPVPVPKPGKSPKLAHARR